MRRQRKFETIVANTGEMNILEKLAGFWGFVEAPAEVFECILTKTSTKACLVVISSCNRAG